MNQTSLSPLTSSPTARANGPLTSHDPARGIYRTASGVKRTWPPRTYSRMIFCPSTDVTQATYCIAAM